MKKTLVLLLTVLALAGCTPKEDILVIEPTTLALKVGQTAHIDIAGTEDGVEWKSENEDVATVSYGMVSAKAIGRTNIVVTRGAAMQKCEVFVTGSDGSMLRISPYSASLKKGETLQMKYGSTLEEVELKWSTTNANVITVDQTGLVRAIGPGLAEVKLTNGLTTESAMIAVEHNWGEYKLVWEDNFDVFDKTVWNFNTGTGGNWGWGNGELQYYTDRTKNVRAEGGYLVIEAFKEDTAGSHYTSGRIKTSGAKEFLYGKFEARIKFPGGQGTWPAWWMMGNSGSWPACGEIDIMEHVGSIDKRASFALHTPLKNGTLGNNWSKVVFFNDPLSEDFHIYGVEWAQQEKNGLDVIRFYIDGVTYAEVWQDQYNNNDSWPFQKKHYMILNLAIGGTMGGRVEDAIFNKECKMLVDWVRVYQRDEKE